MLIKLSNDLSGVRSYFFAVLQYLFHLYVVVFFLFHLIIFVLNLFYNPCHVRSGAVISVRDHPVNTSSVGLKPHLQHNWN